MEEKRRLPKNVCQMGDPESAVRVYLEDYVNVFLKKAVAEDISSVGVFLGESCEIDGVPHVFVHGAMVMDGAVTPGGAVRVDEHLRAGMEQAAEKCFPGDSIVGWFLSGDAGNDLDCYQCQKLKRQILTARDTLFCINNAEDRTFYRMSGDDCRPLRGYFIYYEKNQNMQEYMLVCSLSKKVEPPEEEETARVVRQVLEERKEESRRRDSGRLAYGLCAVLTVFLAAAGAVILNGRLEKNPSSETEAPANAEAGGKNSGLVIYEVDGNVYPTETETAAETTAESTAEPTAEPETESTEESTAEPDTTVQETEETTGAEPEYTLYTVTAGEGLAAIARAQYGYADSELLKEICQLNGLPDANMVQAGQQIKLPRK